MSTQGSISRELFQSSLADYTTYVQPIAPAVPCVGVTPTPGYSTSFLFVRTPVGIEVKLPPIVGVIGVAGGPAGPLPIGWSGIIPYNCRPVVNTTLFAFTVDGVGETISAITYQANGDLIMRRAIGGPNFTVAGAIAVSPVSHAYSAGSVLEVTE
jgi:hypothetical protein